MWGAPPERKEEMLTVGDGAIWSTVEDVARWDAAVRAGKYFKKPLARAAMTHQTLAMAPRTTTD